MRKTILLLCALLVASYSISASKGVKIINKNARILICINGRPTYIKGVGGTFSLDVAKKMEQMLFVHGEAM